jgi:hypothetical protein
MLAVPRAMMTTLPWKQLIKVDLQIDVDFASRSTRADRSITGKRVSPDRRARTG